MSGTNEQKGKCCKCVNCGKRPYPQPCSNRMCGLCCATLQQENNSQEKRCSFAKHQRSKDTANGSVSTSKKKKQGGSGGSSLSLSERLWTVKGGGEPRRLLDPKEKERIRNKLLIQNQMLAQLQSKQKDALQNPILQASSGTREEEEVNVVRQTIAEGCESLIIVGKKRKSPPEVIFHDPVEEANNTPFTSASPAKQKRHLGANSTRSTSGDGGDKNAPADTPPNKKKKKKSKTKAS